MCSIMGDNLFYQMIFFYHTRGCGCGVPIVFFDRTPISICSLRYSLKFFFNFRRQLPSSPSPSPTRFSSLTQTNHHVEKQLNPSYHVHQSHTYPLLGRLRASMPIPESTHSRTTHFFISKALKVSAKMGFLHEGKQVHSHVIKLGYYSGLSMQNQILNVYVKCKEFGDALNLFDEMPLANVVTWNTMICGVIDCSRSWNSNIHLGFRYFKKMLLVMVDPDYLTFNGLLRACIELNDVEIGEQLHGFVVKLGLHSNCFVGGALVDLYAKFGLVGDARCAFDMVLFKDLVLWNVMVSCYSLNCLAEEAFGVYNLMQLEGVRGDEFTFPSLLSSCCIYESSDLGKQIHSIIIRLSYDLDVLVASAIVDMYAKNESIADARKAFNVMGVRNVASWTTMLVGYGQNGYGKDAVKLLRDMFRENYAPDELALASIFRSCGYLSSTKEIMQTHAYTIKNGFQAFLSIANAQINAYSKCGSIANAIQSFSSIAAPDIVSWTSITNAYAFHGLPRDGIEIFEKILSTGMRPDRISFLSVLSACCHGGLVGEGLHYFDLMTNYYQILPDSEHYTCLIDLLGRAGLLDEAFNVLTSMPLEPGPNSLGAFIGSCKVHGNVGLAKWAAEKLFTLEPHKPVNYALMSNTYASVGNWFDVARLRKMMRNMCDHKVPGYSWMEIAGQVHSFMSSDKSHPRALEIFAMLGILIRLMKEDDYGLRVEEGLLYVTELEDECAL